jgi:chorismate mutase
MDDQDEEREKVRLFREEWAIRGRRAEAAVARSVRDHAARAGEVPPILHGLRAQIDEVDSALAALLRRRVALVEAATFVKGVAGIPGHDPNREEDLLKRFSPAEGPERDAHREVIRVCREHAQKRLGEAPVPGAVDDGDRPADAERPGGR